MFDEISKTLLYIIVSVGVVLAVGASAACQKTLPVGPPAAQADPLTAPPPLRIVLFYDTSLSTYQTRTPSLTTAQLEVLLGVLQQRGGELALGNIGVDSNQNLLRVRIDPPPLPPVQKKLPNPLLEQRRQRQLAVTLVQYDHDLQTWQAKTEAALTTFRSAADPLLRKPARARRTDIYGAFQRANLFLQEDTRSWTVPVERYAIFITDGLDDAGRAPVSLDGPATHLVLVNGSASLGVFATLQPKIFESIDAAFLDLVTTTTKEK